MARGRQIAGPNGQPTPMQAVDMASQEYLASEIERVYASVKDYDQSTIKGQLWQKPANGQGGYGFVEEIYPKPGPEPFDLAALLTDLKERFGFGQFELRIFGGGRQRVVVQLPVARERGAALGAAAPAAAAAVQGMGTTELFAMMMSQASEARREASAAADRQMTAIVGLAGVVAPLLLQKPQPSTSMADTLALVTAMQAAGNKGASMKDMVETLVALKGLAGGEGGGSGGGEGGGSFDLGEILNDGGRLVGPAVKALADLVNRNREAGAPGGPSASGTAPPVGGGGQLALGPPGAPASRFPVLDLVRTDVVYFFGRGFDPEKAADLVYDVIEANIEAGVITGDQVNEVAAAFALSPSGLADLAIEGIDLTSNPEWAAEFFQHLATIHSEAATDLGGGEGSPPNPVDDGKASQAGKA